MLSHLMVSPLCVYHFCIIIFVRVSKQHIEVSYVFTSCRNQDNMSQMNPGQIKLESIIMELLQTSKEFQKKVIFKLLFVFKFMTFILYAGSPSKNQKI
jgi:hypothetical protein